MTQSTEIHLNGSGSGSDNSELSAGADCLRHQVNSNAGCGKSIQAVDKLLATDNTMKEVCSDSSDILFDMKQEYKLTVTKVQAALNILQ